MVQIHVKISEDGELDEWSIIELQGDLEVENGESLANKFMADLHFNKDGTPILVLGHHTLFGKVLNLEKPMVVLKKNVLKCTYLDSDEENMDVEEKKLDNDLDEKKTVTEYLVKAVIRKKILFNKRPRPIVTCDVSVPNK